LEVKRCYRYERQSFLCPPQRVGGARSEGLIISVRLHNAHSPHLHLAATALMWLSSLTVTCR